MHKSMLGTLTRPGLMLENTGWWNCNEEILLHYKKNLEMDVSPKGRNLAARLISEQQ